MNQRRGKGIWEGLYEFPLVETASEAQLENLVADVPAEYSVINKEPVLYNDLPVVHKLSHQHIYTKFWIVKCDELPKEALSLAEVNKLPVPVLIENFIDTFDF